MDIKHGPWKGLDQRQRNQFQEPSEEHVICLVGYLQGLYQLLDCQAREGFALGDGIRQSWDAEVGSVSDATTARDVTDHCYDVCMDAAVQAGFMQGLEV